MRPRMTWLHSPLLIAGLTSLAACGTGMDEPPGSGSPTGCVSGVAQIGVSDSYLQIHCGCSEAAGTTVGAGTALTCTVPSGTQVTFHYIATEFPHQIVATGTPSFDPSAYHDPDAYATTRVHVVQLSTAGTYAFADTFNSSLTGQIVVTP